MTGAASVGFGIWLLLHCAICGYLLTNTRIAQKLLRRTYGSVEYFRFLVAGYVWLALCYAILAQFPQLMTLLAGFLNERSVAGLQPHVIGATAVILALLFNMIDKLHTRFRSGAYQRKAAIALASGDREMERTLYNAAIDGKHVMITMKNRKIYAGVPIVEPYFLPRQEPTWTRIMPMLSGYREKDTLKVNLTTIYTAVYRKMNPEQMRRFEFSVTIAVADISSIEEFDPEVFMQFNPEL